MKHLEYKRGRVGFHMSRASVAILRSSYTAGRDTWNNFLGNTGYEFVRTGNLLACRLVLMLLVCSSKGARWVVEQPEGSSLPHHPRFQELLSIVKVPCYELEQVCKMFSFNLYPIKKNIPISSPKYVTMKITCF